MNKMSYQLISNILAIFHSSVTDGWTDGQSLLERCYGASGNHPSTFLNHFQSNLLLFEIFNSSVTNQPTDRASYRGAMAHLKTEKNKIEGNVILGSNQGLNITY